MTPEKLIKALETAESGDRELDASVAEAVADAHGWRIVHSAHTDEPGVVKANPRGPLPEKVWPGQPINVPEFTSAPELAVAAVPFRWKSYSVDEDEDGRFVCTLETFNDDEAPVTGTGHTPALAICAAAVVAAMVDNVVRGRESSDE